MDGFAVRETGSEDGHSWAVVDCTCSLTDEDPVVSGIAQLIRDCYGEKEILDRAERYNAVSPDPGVEQTFDLRALKNAVRMGLPNPDEEGDKPPQLRTYRSETAEMVARSALETAYGFEFPPAPQAGKTNANQPILGFDGWALERLNAEDYAFVLTQVKGTDQNKYPPDQADVLVDECRRITDERGKLARSFTVIVQLLEKDSALEGIVIKMLEKLGRGSSPVLLVAPAIIRGTTASEMKDLEPLRNAAASLPVKSRCVSVSVGVSLNDFGEYVMNQARATA